LASAVVWFYWEPGRLSLRNACLPEGSLDPHIHLLLKGTRISPGFGTEGPDFYSLDHLGYLQILVFKDLY
jgi:hypothetical protein